MEGTIEDKDMPERPEETEVFLDLSQDMKDEIKTPRNALIIDGTAVPDKTRDNLKWILIRNYTWPDKFELVYLKKGKHLLLLPAVVPRKTFLSARITALSNAGFTMSLWSMSAIAEPVDKPFKHPCAHCCLMMVEGTRWACNTCKNYNLCEKCYDAEQKCENRERHPTNSLEKHTFKPVAITDIPKDTKDKGEIIESEFFDTRQSFLSLCQGNHYQYDTLRRAKHSSIMVLYHLHNPTTPAFVTTCDVCFNDVETNQGWRCELCEDFDVCNACYQKEGVVSHINHTV